MSSHVPVALARGQLLRIVDGKGTRIAAKSGMLWISEEGSLVDRVLLPGEAVTLRRDGKALAHAVVTSRAVVEIPQGAMPPRRVEVASAEGRRGRRVHLPLASSRAAVLASRVTRLVLGLLDSAVMLLLHTKPSRHDAGSGLA